MNFSRFLIGGAACAALLFLSGCDGALKEDNGGKEEPEKVKVEFSQNEISIPIKGTSTLELTVTPIERAGEVEIVVADDEVVTLTDKETTETGIRLSLASNSRLGSTTIYAVHEDLEDTPGCKVTITPIALESISLDKTSVELKVYETVTLSPTLTPADVTSPTLVWSSDDPEVASVDNGVVTANKPGTATVTVSCNGKQATCVVKVSSIPAESIKLYFEKAEISEKEISVEESFRIDAEILPEEATYKTVSEWSVSDPEVLSCEAIDISGNTLSAYVTGKAAGTAQVIAKIEIGEGKDALVATCNVTVKALVPPAAPPKIGDYFYSDGTWSDGGLVSINKTGTKVEWAAGKPAPIEGKTVIGIVFQTDSERFSDDEKNSGYNHGLVFCLKSAHGDKSALTRYAFEDSAIDFLGSKLTGLSWYSDINGYSENQKVISRFSTQMDQVPAFDFVHTDFSPAAPSNTSGWFIPSIGQLWDFVANLGGSGVAELLAGFRNYDYDITYYKERSDYQYGQMSVGYNVADILNAHWAKVPESQRDDLVYHSDSSLGNTCWLLSSTSYQKGEACCVIELGDNECIYMTAEYFSNEFCCHPVLAF